MDAMTSTAEAPAQARARARVLLVEELYRRYGGGTSGAGSALRRLRFVRKKYAWLLVVGGAKVFKRTLDLAAALTMLVVLSPLFLVVALLIKLTDGGPVLFWQSRVGRWGREFPFPKFRSMVVNAPSLVQALGAQNIHGPGGVTFKDKRDPRVTRVGRVIRKLSIDELPQLWCVLKGQ